MPAKLALYALLVAAYFLTYFFRVSSSILLPRLAAEWALGPGVAGLLSSLYFYTYALAQPLGGSLNDRFGPARVVPAGLLITATGALAMGLATTPLAFAVGRALTGLGVAPMLSGALAFQSAAFPAALYTTLSGITFASGNFGSVASVAPLDAAIGAWGRAAVFAGLALGGVALAVALTALRSSDPVPEASRGKAIAGKTVIAGFASAFRTVLGLRQLRRILLLWGTYFGSLMALQGLWAVSWYEAAFGLSRAEAGAWATLISIGVAVGALLGGRGWKGSSDRQTAIRVSYSVYAGAFASLWLSLAWAGSAALTGCIGFLVGFAGGFCTDHLTAGLNDVVGPGRAGSTFGAMNTLIFAAIIAYQSGTGLLLSALRGAAGGIAGAAGGMAASGAGMAASGAGVHGAYPFLATFALVALTLVPGLIALIRLGRFDEPR